MFPSRHQKTNIGKKGLFFIEPISGQYSNFIFHENIRKLWFSGVFRDYKMGILARYRLNNCMKITTVVKKINPLLLNVPFRPP